MATVSQGATQKPLSSFPVIAWSVTFKEDFLTLPKTLQATGDPPLAVDRPSLPLIMMKGQPLS